jgi:hypothetical protein
LSSFTKLLLLLLQVDDMLAQAQSVSRSLLEQRRIFGNVQDKLGTIGEKFPAISGLLNAIRRKKSKVRQCTDCYVVVVGLSLEQQHISIEAG